VNRQVDVYEFEPKGVGGSSGCTTASSTFDSVTGGCVDLISSGRSHQESAFLDASGSGDDVFFMTSEQLVAQDKDTSLDVYDAHVCGAEGVPCTAGALSPAECTTADACRVAPAPQPGVFGAPASATFSGPGDLAPVPVVKKVTKKTVKCKKGATKKKDKCTKAKRKKKGSNHGKGSK
jgi:hypothetical protein